MKKQDERLQLAETEVERDLGVMVDNRLSFKSHIATAKANKVVGIIRRTFDHLTEQTFIELYKSLVRPLLEYGHCVWQPIHTTLCSDVEDAQRRATKLLSSLKDKTIPREAKGIEATLSGTPSSTWRHVEVYYTCMVTTLSHALVLRWLQQETYEEIHVNSIRANSEPVLSQEIISPSESPQTGTAYQSQLLQLHL